MRNKTVMSRNKVNHNNNLRRLLHVAVEKPNNFSHITQQIEYILTNFRENKHFVFSSIQ